MSTSHRQKFTLASPPGLEKSNPRLERQRACLRSLWLIRNTWDRRMRAFVRGAIRADVRVLRGVAS